MNIELLRKIEAHILEEPKRLHMGSFIMLKNKQDKLIGVGGVQVEFPDCGTAACIAGWAVVLENGVPEYFNGASVYSEAQRSLDLTVGQADRLFYRLAWPDKFLKMGGGTDNGTLETAQATAARIEHFIETGGRE